MYLSTGLEGKVLKNFTTASKAMNAFTKYMPRTTLDDGTEIYDDLAYYWSGADNSGILDYDKRYDTKYWRTRLYNGLGISYDNLKENIEKNNDIKKYISHLYFIFESNKDRSNLINADRQYNLDLVNDTVITTNDIKDFIVDFFPTKRREQLVYIRLNSLFLKEVFNLDLNTDPLSITADTLCNKIFNVENNSNSITSPSLGIITKDMMEVPYALALLLDSLWVNEDKDTSLFEEYAYKPMSIYIDKILDKTLKTYVTHNITLVFKFSYTMINKDDILNSNSSSIQTFRQMILDKFSVIDNQYYLGLSSMFYSPFGIFGGTDSRSQDNLYLWMESYLNRKYKYTIEDRGFVVNGYPRYWDVNEVDYFTNKYSLKVDNNLTPTQFLTLLQAYISTDYDKQSQSITGKILSVINGILELVAMGLGNITGGLSYVAFDVILQLENIYLESRNDYASVTENNKLRALNAKLGMVHGLILGSNAIYSSYISGTVTTTQLATTTGNLAANTGNAYYTFIEEPRRQSVISSYQDKAKESENLVKTIMSPRTIELQQQLQENYLYLDTNQKIESLLWEATEGKVYNAINKYVN